MWDSPHAELIAMHACGAHLNSVMKHNQNDGDCQGCGKYPPHQPFQHTTKKGILQQHIVLVLMHAATSLSRLRDPMSNLLHTTTEIDCLDTLFLVQGDIHCHLNTCSVASLHNLDAW